MSSQEDVRRIALSLPETSEGEKGFGFGVMTPEALVSAFNA